MTQQELAVALKKAVVTVARWETSREPAAEELGALVRFCMEHGLKDLAEEFLSALKRKLLLPEPIPETLEEQSFRELLYLVARNRGLPEIGQHFEQSLVSLIAAFHLLAERLRRGEQVVGLNPDSLEVLEPEVKAMEEELRRRQE